MYRWCTESLLTNQSPVRLDWGWRAPKKAHLTKPLSAEVIPASHSLVLLHLDLEWIR